ncbi:MAG: RagB/SusD family nutrient uptake outer membrane protein [Gemmatimonadota bacterium]|nr:RagB/SusD family nutrient uptake outer membrane protein [Gemmatimonadota bacterium]
MSFQDDRAERDRGGWTGRRTVLGTLMVLVATAGCDFDVSNPGPVADDLLNNPASHGAVVGGIQRALSDAWNEVALEASAATREIVASGNLNISVAQGRGIFEPDESNGMWSDVHNAIWVGDDAVRRFAEIDADPEILAEAHLWAGFAYRMAGEHFCQAVFNGGPAEPHTRYLEGAVDHFTNAAELTNRSEIEMAALAGRATAHMTLGNWGPAVNDAIQVPEDFAFQTKFAIEDPDQWNDIAFFVANQPYRVHSVWNTPYEEYYPDTGDPRTQWNEDPNFPFGEVERPGIGNVPWKFQLKYTTMGDNVDLVTGREMRLIEAEALLVDDEWEEAMEIVNALRTSQISDTTGEPLEPWSASSLEEAWTRFKRERGIELWLEARRLNDLRRWDAAGTPGDLHPLEDPASGVETFLAPDRDLCVPYPRTSCRRTPT